MVEHDSEAASPVELLLDRVLAAPEADWNAELETACREHPHHAAVLRRRFAALSRVGLVAPSPLPAIAPGTQLGGYELTAPLGAGGMGLVFRARRASDGSEVAIKVLRADLRDHTEARERLLREGRLARDLGHHHLCAVEEVGEDRGVLFLVMPLVRGEPLLQRMRARQAQEEASPAAVDSLVLAFARVADGLGSLHARNLVHRDVKPANLLFDEAGELVLVDFGLAVDAASTRLTVPGAPVGTPAYMPPEQVRGASTVTPAADVYGLGATLFEALAQRPPFVAGDRETLYRSILHDDPPDLRTLNRHVSRNLWAVVWRCLQKDVRRRYPDGAELARDLEAAAAHRPVTARVPGPLVRLGRATMRHPVAAAAATVFALAAAVVVLVVQRAEERATAIAIAIASDSAAVERLNPAFGALLAREALRRSETYETRSRWLAARAALAQTGEVRFDSYVGWFDLSPDGNHLAAAVNGGSASVTTAGGAPRQVAWGAGFAGAMAPTGDCFAVVGQRLSLLSPTTGQLISEGAAPDPGPQNWLVLEHVPLITWLPTGELLVGAADGAVHRYDRSGRSLGRLPSVGDAIVALAAPSAEELLLATRSGSIVLLGMDGVVRDRVDPPAPDSVMSSWLTPGRRQLVLGTDAGRVLRCDVDANLSVEVLDVDSAVTEVTSSPDGEVVVALTQARSLYRWPRGGEPTRLPQACNSVGSAAAITDDGLIAVGEVQGAITVRDSTLRVRQRLLGHGYVVNTVRFRRGNRELVSGGWDGTIRTWCLSDPQMPVLWGLSDAVFGAAWLADGAHIAGLDYFGRVLLWNGDDLVDHSEGTHPAEYRFGLGPERRRILTGRGCEFVWQGDDRLRPGAPAWEEHNGRGMVGLRDGSCWNGKGRQLRRSSADGRSMLDVDLPFYVEAFDVHEPRGEIAVVGSDQRLLWLDLDGGQLRPPTEFAAERLTAVCWRGDGTRLAVGAMSGTVWILAGPTDIPRPLHGHQGQIRAARWTPAGDYLITGSSDGTARVWTADGEPVAEVAHPGIVHGVDVHPDGRRFLTAGSDGAVRIWPLPVGDHLRASQEIYRDFTAAERERLRELVR